MMEKNVTVSSQPNSSTTYRIQEILNRPDENNRYGQIKTTLLKIFDKTQEENHQILLNMDNLGNRKPSNLSQEM